LKVILDEDLSPQIKNIEKETLIIWGENDFITPLSYAKIFKEQIKNSELIVLKNSSHYPFLDNKDQFINTIIKYFKF